jgi:hypothetical protein
VYEQPDEPIGAAIGSMWIDTDDQTSGAAGNTVLVMTQASYDALPTKDPATVYVVT